MIQLDEIFLKIASEEETIQFVKDTLQQELYSEGVDGAEYSETTIDIKKRKGQPTDRVTLRDTGSFYDTWNVEATADRFIITSDPEKNGSSLFDKYNEDDVYKTMSEDVLREINQFFNSRLAEILNVELYKTLGI
jgi:hypothetical protein